MWLRDAVQSEKLLYLCTLKLLDLERLNEDI